jgi:chaperonin GroES
MMQLAKPLGDRILLTINDAPEQKTSGGIIIPDSVRTEDIKTGEIVAVGEGLYTQNGVRIPMTVSVGDTVMYSPYTGTEVTLSGVKYLLMRESEALLVIN